MILKSLKTTAKAFETATGWQLKPEGACKGDVCIPLKSQPEDVVNIEALARDMNLPLVHDAQAELWALGPESIGGSSLTTAEAADFELPDINGNLFKLSSLKGKKILVYAWAPY